MAFNSVTSLFASVIGVTADEFTELRKAWQVAVENGSQESFLAFLCRERGLAEDVFLQRLAAALNWVGSSRVDLQACKLEYSIVSPK